jgi:hypothetical protein
VADYTRKISEICESLASVDVDIDDNEKVQIYLGGLASKFGAFRTAVCTRETTLSFFDFQSMLLVEENHVGASTSTRTDSKMLYTEGERPRGRGDEDAASRCAMEATDRDSTREMLTTTPDPPEVGGVVESQLWTACTLATEATGRASA